MHTGATGWKRLGISLSLIWLLGVIGFATYEYLNLPVAGYFVDSVIAKTGEPFSELAGNQ
jgi:hypothetical protein